MARYRIDVLDHHGDVCYEIFLFELTDGAAISQAKIVLPDATFELFHGDRFVHREGLLPLLDTSEMKLRRPKELRILVVEDELLFAVYLEAIIKEYRGVMVGPYEYVPDVLEIIDGNTFDIALLDVNLKGVMSYPIADALVRREIPFAFLTSNSIHSIPADLQHVPVLRKPYRFSAVLDLLVQLEHQAVEGIISPR